MGHLINNMKTWKMCMSLAQSCTNMQQLKSIHAIFITQGLHHNTFAISKLLAFCALSDHGSLHYASLIFTQTPAPNSFICNTLIRAYSHSSQPLSALHYFKLMLQNEAMGPNHHTFPFVLIACANGSLSFTGRQVHCLVVKNGLGLSDGYVQTALVRFYSGCTVMDDARKSFDEIPHKDVIQWNVLISGYVGCGSPLEALDSFRTMWVSEIEPDEFCVTTTLKACALLGALEQGKWIHEYVKKSKELVSDAFVGTALVDMYAKCGCIEMAMNVFERIPRRNVFSWAAMIGGFAVHGLARRAISSLKTMQVEDGVRPDGIVLLGVLTACARAGFVKEGQNLLDNMESLYGVLPKYEHYSCVVDLLCRSGQLDEAHQLIRRMPMKPLASVWGALLSGCRTSKDTHLAELAVENLLSVEAHDKMEENVAYVQLSNIYLATGKYEDARRIRRMIGDRGLKKMPGCSALEVDGEVIEFVSGDVSRPHCADIQAILDLLYVHSIRHPLGVGATSLLEV